MMDGSYDFYCEKWLRGKKKPARASSGGIAAASVSRRSSWSIGGILDLISRA